MEMLLSESLNSILTPGEPNETTYTSLQKFHQIKNTEILKLHTLGEPLVSMEYYRSEGSSYNQDYQLRLMTLSSRKMHQQ
jgi:hypothetical protein